MVPYQDRNDSTFVPKDQVSFIIAIEFVVRDQFRKCSCERLHQFFLEFAVVGRVSDPIEGIEYVVDQVVGAYVIVGFDNSFDSVFRLGVRGRRSGRVKDDGQGYVIVSVLVHRDRGIIIVGRSKGSSEVVGIGGKRLRRNKRGVRQR